MRNPSAPIARIAFGKNSLYGPISGADETLVTYACHLHAMHHDVTVVLFYPPLPGDVFLRRLVQQGVPVVVLAKHSRIYDFLRRARRILAVARQTVRREDPLAVAASIPVSPRSSVKLRRTFWRFVVRRMAMRYHERTRAHFAEAGYSIVHVVTPDSGAEVMIRAAADAQVPVLYHEMGTPFHMPELDGAYRNLARVTPLCTRIAALSPILAKQWTEYLPHRAEAIVLPLLVARPRRWAIPRRAGGAGPVIGFAARMQAGKGPQILIEAFAKVLATGRTPLLRLAGAGELTSTLKQLSRKLGISEQCEFVGAYDSREGCAVFLQTLDVFVLPSFAEGTPNSIIEAMACGVPVVASAVGGVPDILLPDAGILFPPGDVEALTAALISMIDDPDLRSRMGAAGQQRYDAVYSPEAALPTLLATYAEVRDAVLVAG